MKIIYNISTFFLSAVIFITYLIDSKNVYLLKVFYFNASVIAFFFLNSRFQFIKKFHNRLTYPVVISVLFAGSILVQSLSHITNIEIPKMKNILMVIYFIYICLLFIFTSKDKFDVGFIFPVTIFLFTSFTFQWAYNYSFSSYSALIAYSLYSFFYILRQNKQSSSKPFFILILVYLPIGLLLTRAITSDNQLLIIPASYRYISGILLTGMLVFSRGKLKIFRAFAVIILAELLLLFISSIFMIAQSFHLKNFFNKKSSLFSVNANDIAFFFLITLSFLMAYIVIIFKKRSTKANLISASFIVITIYLLVFMVSRTSLLVATMSFFFLIIQTRLLQTSSSYKIVFVKVGLVVLLLLSIIYFGSKNESFLNTESLFARTGLWRLGISKILQTPLLGQGADNYLYLGISYLNPVSFSGYTTLKQQLGFFGSFLHTHNTVLAILYENGIIFFALFVFFHLLIFPKRVRHSSRRYSFIFYGGITAILTSQIYGLMNYSFMILHIWVFYCSVLGLLISKTRVQFQFSINPLIRIAFGVLLSAFIVYFLVVSFFFTELLKSIEAQLRYNTLRNFRLEDKNLPSEEELRKALIWATLLKNISLSKDTQILQLYSEINKALYLKTGQKEYLESQFQALEKCKNLNPEQLSCYKLLIQFYPDKLSENEKSILENHIRSRDFFKIMELEKTFQIR